MAAACGLTIVKKFTYRGDPTEEYSNTYWLTGSAPATAADWRTLFDALVVEEKKVYAAGVNVIRGYGYDNDSGHAGIAGETVAAAVWSVDLTVAPNTIVPGTMSAASSVLGPGDSATWIRWKTSRLNTKGKPIYLRKYFHPGYADTANMDNASTTWKTAAGLFGTKLRDGSFTTGRTLTAARHTDVLVGAGVSTYLTTRTLKRRGKRPGS